MKKKLLFVTYGGGHAHMVYPVVHALHESAEFKNGKIAIHILALPAAKAILETHGVECFGFADFLDPIKDADALEWGRQLAAGHHSPASGIDLADSIAYLGLNYKDLVMRLGHAQAEALFKEKARHAFYPLTIMERIFDAIKPDFVITTNSPRSEAAAIEVANVRGIGTLIMTDLFSGLGDYRLKANHITFLNAFARDMFAADGLIDESTSRFYLTGNPAFDRILPLAREKNQRWRHEHFSQAAEKKLVLHADMPAYWHPVKKRSHIKTEAGIIEEMEACYDAAMQCNAAYLIRPHPSQDRQLYASWLAGRKWAYLAADYDLHALLANIDLLVARTTTVGLEAAYMQKRILQLDCDLHSDLPLAKMGIAWGVNGYGELAREMKNALTDDKKFEEMKNKAEGLLPREPAAVKIATIILEILT